MSFWSSLNACAANHGSLSEIMDSGRPNHLNKLLCNSLLMTIWSEVFVIGMRITPFIRPWSTMDKIQLQSTLSAVLETGRSVIRCIEQSANGCEDCDPAIGVNAGFDGDQLILNSWHFEQPDM